MPKMATAMPRQHVDSERLNWHNLRWQGKWAKGAYLALGRDFRAKPAWTAEAAVPTWFLLTSAQSRWLHEGWLGGDLACEVESGNQQDAEDDGVSEFGPAEPAYRQRLLAFEKPGRAAHQQRQECQNSEGG